MSEEPEPEPLSPGELVAGRYRIDRLLGKGGMGAVYVAQHVELHRSVAVKVLLPAYAQNGDVVARFLREARSAAGIGHPGIVEIFDLGRHGNMPFIAMEKLNGEELHDRIAHRQGPLPIAMVAGIGVELCEAIAAAHAHGIVHRDLKPQNVFLARRGDREIVKVLDFGIAKLVEGDRADASLTKTGQIFGTPLYMAPEQMRDSKDTDGRADVYSIGSILYEALSGHPPFQADSYPGLVLKVATEPPEPLAPQRPDAPPELIEIVARAMAKSPAQRVQSAAELASLLRPFIHVASSVVAPAPRASLATDATAPSLGCGAPPPAHTTSSPASLAGALPPLGDGAARSGAGSTGPLSAPPPARTDPVMASLSATPWVATSEAPPPLASRSTPWWKIGVGAGVLLVGAAGAIGITSALTVGSGAPTAASSAPASVAPPPAEVEPSPVVSAAVAPSPVLPPPARATTRVHVEVDPAGAEVRAGDRFCISPCDIELAGASTRVELRHAGYSDLSRELTSPYPASLFLTMERTRRVRRAAAPSSDDPPPLLPR